MKKNIAVACDFDGTLAYYDRWRGAMHFGAPIPAMVKKVQWHIAKGDTVWIFTARIQGDENHSREEVIEGIQQWCERHIGQRLDVTNIKRTDFDLFYDDRAIQVIKNTGKRVVYKETKE